MKKNNVLFLAALFCSVAQGDIKIGVVHTPDLHKISEKMEKTTKDLSEKMQDLVKKFEACKKEAEAEMKKIKSLSSLKPEDSQKKMGECQKDFESKIKDLQEKEAVLRKEMDLAGLDLQDNIRSMLLALGKEKKLDLILEKNAVLYSSDKSVVDLTEEASKSLKALEQNQKESKKST